MPGTARSYILTCVLVAACAPQDTAPPPMDTAADEAAVNAVREAEVAAIASGDASGAYLSADAVMMPPGEPAVVGIEAIRAWAGEFLGMFESVEPSYTESEITVSGDWAVERYAGTITMTPGGGGEAMTEAMKGIHVYRREPDGSWKMVYDVWNTDTPPPGM